MVNVVCSLNALYFSFCRFFKEFTYYEFVKQYLGSLKKKCFDLKKIYIIRISSITIGRLLETDFLCCICYRSTKNQKLIIKKSKIFFLM